VANVSRKFIIVGAFGLLGPSISALIIIPVIIPAHAQGTPALPLNLPPAGTTVEGPAQGVRQVTPPPAGFDPLTASPAANAKYAIPPAPDAKAAPGAYAKWQRAVSGIANPQNRVLTTLTPTNISHGPAKIMGNPIASGFANNIATITSSNWSGNAVYNPSNPFTVEVIIGEFTVPTAHQALGGCNGGWDYSALWPGIDGFASDDVLQAGAEVDAYCSGTTTQSFYSAWVEWYPNDETRVSFPINPGDVLFVEVWNTSPTNGYAYFYDNSTGQSAEYNLTAPSGTSLVGSSVEWVVERPSVGASLATLTNYVYSEWTNGVAGNYTASSPTPYFEGQNPAAGTLYQITMLDNNGNGISSATIEDVDFLLFKDFGSAF